MKKSVLLSVSDFALPAPRQGHIETHSGYGHLPRVGEDLHRKIQAQRELAFTDYESEKWISHTFRLPSAQLCVSGRMDGFRPGPPAHIEEIKSAYDLDRLRERLQSWPHHPYHLQAATYGYFVYQQTGQWPKISLHLVSSLTGDGEDLPVNLTLLDYETWLERRLAEIRKEISDSQKHQVTFPRLAEIIRFPFAEFRQGQKTLIEQVEISLSKKQPLLLQAPTGMGKTLGVTFPSLRESLRHHKPLIYLTPKNSQHSVAEEAVEHLREALPKSDPKTSPQLRSLTIHAKGKMCLKSEPLCNPDHCEYAKNHYQKVAENSIIKKLRKKTTLSRQEFLRAGEKYQVCPFELQLEMIPWSHVVICDYNYIFSPSNSIKRFGHFPYRPLSTKSETSPILVVDEMHNLVSRAMDYFSAELKVSDVKRLIDAIKNKIPEALHNHFLLFDQLDEFLSTFTPANGASAEDRTFPLPIFQYFQKELMDLWSIALKQSYNLERRDPFLKLINSLDQFVTTLAEWTNQPAGWCSFVESIRARGGTDCRLRLMKFDVSEHLKSIYEQFPQMVGFSATLKPFLYYQRLLGLDGEQVRTAELPFPFATAHRKILIVPQVSTKYSQREDSLLKICALVERITILRPGNYAVFFPSFEYLKKFSEAWLSESPSRMSCLTQERDMPPHRTVEMLATLRAAITPTLLIGVQGGVFSEGIDYLGDMLLGAFIIGPPLPVFDYEHERMRTHYQNKFEEGFNYTYVYPAMAKAIQAAGRVVRSSSDRGVIILVDQRFLLTDYAKALPQDWFQTDVKELVSNQILKDLTDFWSQIPTSVDKTNQHNSNLTYTAKDADV